MKRVKVKRIKRGWLCVIVIAGLLHVFKIEYETELLKGLSVVLESVVIIAVGFALENVRWIEEE